MYKIVKRKGDRPWKIVNKLTNGVVGSSKTKSEAEASIRARYTDEK